MASLAITGHASTAFTAQDINSHTYTNTRSSRGGGRKGAVSLDPWAADHKGVFDRFHKPTLLTFFDELLESEYLVPEDATLAFQQRKAPPTSTNSTNSTNALPGEVGSGRGGSGAISGKDQLLQVSLSLSI